LRRRCRRPPRRGVCRLFARSSSVGASMWRATAGAAVGVVKIQVNRCRAHSRAAAAFWSSLRTGPHLGHMLPSPVRRRDDRGAWARLKMPDNLPHRWPGALAGRRREVMTATMANRMARAFSDDGISLPSIPFYRTKRNSPRQDARYTSALAGIRDGSRPQRIRSILRPQEP